MKGTGEFESPFNLAFGIMRALLSNGKETCE